MERQKEIYRVTLIGSAVNIGLVAFKFAAGILGHSAAMLADAFHSLADLISDAVIIIFVHIAGKPGDSAHAYGYGKFETLGSLIVGLLLMGVALGFLLDSLESIFAFYGGKELERPNWWALGAAILSIAFKESLYWYTIAWGRKLESQALEINAWHHRSDAITSIAALLGIGGAMLLGPRWTVLDPLAAVVVSLFIMKMAWSLMMPCIDELMEKSLPPREKNLIGDIILSTKGVVSFHHLRTRKIGAHRAVDVHVKMSGQISLVEAHDIASQVEARLRKAFGEYTFITIHMEPV